jgi:uncharacterized alpha-E superfamily protein
VECVDFFAGTHEVGGGPQGRKSCRMLSRVANSLFWLARYLERAESAARFLVVSESYAQELQGVSRVAAEACRTVTYQLFAMEEPGGKESNMAEFHRLVFDTEVPGSVLSSVTLARENARSIRDAIASEMWEALNVLYLELQEAAQATTSATRRQALLRQVQNTSHLLQGLRDNTMVRSDEWHFLRLGRCLERADSTLRAIDTMFNHPALEAASDAGHEIDTLHLVAALRVCTAFEAFSRNAPVLSPEKVVEFLLLDARFPRSVEFSAQELQRSLHALSQTPPDNYTNPAEQLCGRLVAELRFASIEEILGGGLHDTLQRLRVNVGQIAAAISQEYFA